MSPIWTFSIGLGLLILFGWYFATDISRRKRLLGTALTVAMTAFFLNSMLPPQEKIRLGLDLQGGTSFLIRLDPSLDEQGQKKEITQNMLDQAVEVIRKRVDQFGVSEPVITPQGSDRILVQIPGLDAAKIQDARQQLQQVAKLEFRLVHPQSDALIQQIEAGQAIIPPGYRIEKMAEERQGKQIEEKILLKSKADLTGDRVVRAGPSFDARGWGVHLSFDSTGAEQFGKLTDQVYREHSRLAILLDNVVISAPGVPNGPIYGGNAEITGRFSEQEARNLASALQNPLQTPVKIEEERSASSTLGTDSIKSGIYAGIGGLIGTLIFVVIFYRFAGLVALFGLIINLALLLGAMSMFGFVLTLPGIAGIILTIGMAIDANVLIYERLREELALGKSVGAALDAAYEKAFSSIFDSNVTTLITAGILFWTATGPIKGFAVTLVVGITASVFAAMLVTRTCFSWATAGGFLKRISMLRIISGTKFDFMGRRKLWVGISLAAIGLSIAGFVQRGEKNFGIDFKGGDLLMLSSSTKVSEAQVREALRPIGHADDTIQKETALDKEFITIRSDIGTSDQVEAQLRKALPDAGFKVEKKDKVGRLVGDELAKSSLIALGLGVLGILFYVTLRFEFSFAIGAVVALVHDVVVTLGIFAICGRELSLIMVGAILTIAGYSINDTIVVYDRIREGLKAGRKGSIQDIMNASINETLSRTLLTSGTTLFSVATLYFFGGQVLKDFAFTILIGILVGTYSSIFIASPIVLWWSGQKGRSLRNEVRGTSEAGA